MSTTALLSIYDFGVDHNKHSAFRNSNGSSQSTSTSHLQNNLQNQNNSASVQQFVSLSATTNNNHQTNNTSSCSTISSTGDNLTNITNIKPNLHALSTGPNKKPERMTGLFYQQLSYPTANKMSGGVRRTVSSAAAQQSSLIGSTRNSLNNNTTSSKSNTQPTSNNNILNKNHNNDNSNSSNKIGYHKSSDPHKKLDRSFSEPAEKKGTTAGSSTALGTSSRYKTELCRSFAEVGHCKYGDKCQFAHGDEELRTITRHPKFKTENCKSFHSTGFCPYGPRCHFIHNSEESKKSLLNLPGVNSTPRLFESNPLPITNVVGSNHALTASHSGPGLPLIQNHLPFGSTNVVRPKALLLGSYSLGSSGEISSPSSQSGSPTSLNSFFSEETAFAISSNFGAPNSRIPANFPTANNTFSFSPDSAFVAFNPNSQSNNTIAFNNGGNISCQQKSIFGGSPPSGINSNFSSPEPTIADQTTNSVISQLFGSSCGSPTPFEPGTFKEIIISPLGNHNNKSSQMIFYPTSPESPVDSVASEIEALKLGEMPALTSINFSPISSSFSATSAASSTSSPPDSNHQQIDMLDSFTFLPNVVQPSVQNICVGGPSTNNIPTRLPTFTKIATSSTNNQNLNSHQTVNNRSSSPNQLNLESLE